ncbi:hypothetical protein Dimus_024170 [Dionaea muscipula]
MLSNQNMKLFLTERLRASPTTASTQELGQQLETNSACSSNKQRQYKKQTCACNISVHQPNERTYKTSLGQVWTLCTATSSGMTHRSFPRSSTTGEPQFLCFLWEWQSAKKFLRRVLGWGGL